jgi:DNA helicase-2/ATP-dependent DNA helicase PcrA
MISRPLGGGAVPQYARGAVSDSGFHLGQRVRHGTFGEGVIINFEGQGAHARINVNFAREGAKWLVLSYANLEAV